MLCVLGQAQSQRYSRVTYTYKIQEGDTIFMGYIPNVYVYTPLRFKTEKERIEYTKLVRDVKRTLPYARLIARSIIESYEFMETLPDEKSKQKHLEEVQKYIMKEYKPKMKKLTKRQGQILIKLVDRECNTSSYNIVKSLMGGFRATMYNTFAGIFGNSLKTKYDPNNKDWMIERIVIMIDRGAI